MSRGLIFEGIVIDSYTNEPIKNGIVKVYLIPISLGVYSEIEKGETRTDENGYFELKLESNNLFKARHNWGIKCIKNGFLSKRLIDAGVKMNSIDSTNFNTPIKSDIRLIPKGKLRFNILESNPDFRYSLDYGNTPDRHYFWKDSNYYTHENEVAGDRNTVITFVKRVNGVTFTTKDSIYIEIGETKEMDIDL